MYVLSVCICIATIRCLSCLSLFGFVLYKTFKKKIFSRFYIRRAYIICFLNINFFFSFILMFVNTKIFNRSCYLLIVLIASFHCCPNRMYALHASLNHHVWMDFCEQWPTILSVGYRGRFVNWQIRPKFPVPKMEHSSGFVDSLLHVCVSCEREKQKYI